MIYQCLWLELLEVLLTVAMVLKVLYILISPVISNFLSLWRKLVMLHQASVWLHISFGLAWQISICWYHYIVVSLVCLRTATYTNMWLRTQLLWWFIIYYESVFITVSISTHNSWTFMNIKQTYSPLIGEAIGSSFVSVHNKVIKTCIEFLCDIHIFT